MGENFAHEIKALIQRHQNNTVNIIHSGIDTVDWITLKSEKCLVIHRSVKELLVNLNRHSKASLASLKFNQNTKFIIISYKDNGVGFAENQTKGIGLWHIENRLKQVGGNLSIFNNKVSGAQLEISIPV